MYSNRVLPDMVIGFLISLSIYILIVFEDNKYGVVLGSYLSGSIFGLIVFIKLGAISLFVFLVLALILAYRKDLLTLLSSLYGYGSVIGIYQLILNIDFSSMNIESLMLSYSKFQLSLDQATIWSNLALIPYFIFSFNLSNPEFAQIFTVGILFAVGLVNGVLIIRNRNKESGLKFASIFFLSAFIYMLVGTVSATAYIPVTVVTRYMIYFSLPMALIFADAIRNLKNEYLYIVMFLSLLMQLPVYIYFGTVQNIVYHYT